MRSDFWIVIPFYNEAKGIKATINALACQTDKDFRLLFVNNASNDGGTDTVNTICKSSGLLYEVIEEPEKGTGFAADTGFRYAITHGARYIARTDADCIPAPNWVRLIKQGFTDGLEFMGGRLKPRGDDVRLHFFDHLLLPLLITIGVAYGRLFYRGGQFKYPFLMAAGGNMAITAKLYDQAGGFSRSSIADTNEDTELAERVRCLTTHAEYRRNMIVYASIRRVRKYGYIKTLRWFSDRNYRGEVDVR